MEDVLNSESLNFRKQIEAARERSHGHRTGQIAKAPIPKDEARAMEMGFIYELVLGYYRHRPALRYFKFNKEGIKPRTLTFLKKTANVADALGADYKEYIEAQFYWFHKWFRRPPKIHELSGQSGKFHAIKRYREYTKLKDQNLAHTPTSDVFPHEPLDKSVIDKINSRRLKQLCVAWGLSEVDAMIKFGRSGIFDSQWLRHNSLFLQLKDEGKLV